MSARLRRFRWLTISVLIVFSVGFPAYVATTLVRHAAAVAEIEAACGPAYIAGQLALMRPDFEGLVGELETDEWATGGLYVHGKFRTNDNAGLAVICSWNPFTYRWELGVNDWSAFDR